MADKKITDLAAAASVALTDQIEIADSGPSSKRATITQVQAAVTSGFVPTSRTISTTAPLAGGGDLSANRTFSIADAAADGATKGAAAFLAADFTSAAGVIGIDYTNGQAASAGTKGFLTAADWATFNSKQDALPVADTTAIVKGSADATKLLRFEVDGFTTGTTRVITPPNSNLTLAGIDIANAWSDGVTQTFNPNGTSSGINVGSNAADPSALNNGDIWYQSTANELRARINGATVALGAAGSSPPFDDGTAIIKGSADATKLLRIEVDGFTTGTTRVATPPNQNFTMAGIDVAQTFSAGQTFTPAANTIALNVTGVSITGASSQVFSRIVGTWNTSGTPSAFLIGITDTASNAASKLIELQVGGSEVFSIGKNGALNFLDGVRQTFNPDGTNAGLNVGSHTADPGSPVNGDLWYESTLNELHARINGATVALGAGGGSAPFVDTTAIVKGSADATKLLRFEVDGFTTGTTRIATPPNQDFTIAGTNVIQTFTQEQTFTPPANTEAITITGSSITGANDQSILDISGTWDTSGAPKAFKLNVTNITSDAAAQLVDVQANSSTVFSVDLNGFASISGGVLSGASVQVSSGSLIVGSGGGTFSVASTTGLVTWADGVRQTFNPNGTNAGINVGSHTADPSSPSNGDLWYQSTANELRARINGATVALGAGGGSSPPFDDGTAIIKGSADATKLLRIEVDGFTTGTTRVATPPNQDFTIAGTNVAQTFTVEQTFTPAANTEAITITGFSLTGANAQSFVDISGTWNTSGAPSAIKLNITDTASNSGSFLLDLRVGNDQKFAVRKDGSFFTDNANFDVSASGTLSIAGGAIVLNSDGSLTAATAAFGVSSTGNVDVNESISFAQSGLTILDDGGGELQFPTCRVATGSTFKLGNAAVNETIVPTHSLTILDSDGNAWKFPVVAA